MREIKFRAYDWRNRQMRKGNFFVNFNGDVYEVYTPQDFSIVYHFEVMQYTGLKDTNGKEIYEGDILEDAQKSIGYVFYHDGAFRLSSDQCKLDLNKADSYDDLNRSLIEDNHLAVIGNIYENLEFIEGITNGMLNLRRRNDAY